MCSSDLTSKPPRSVMMLMPKTLIPQWRATITSGTVLIPTGGCFILAHDNIFNRAVLGENALYYGSTDAVTEMLDGINQMVSAHKKEYTERNLEVIRRDYSWEKLVDEHEEYFKWMLSQRKGG